MSSSPGGTTPATSSDSTPRPRNPASSHATCRAGPPTFSRAMMRTTFMQKQAVSVAASAALLALRASHWRRRALVELLFAPVSATRFEARSSDSKVPASVHQPSSSSHVISPRSM